MLMLCKLICRPAMYLKGIGLSSEAIQRAGVNAVGQLCRSTIAEAVQLAGRQGIPNGHWGQREGRALLGKAHVGGRHGAALQLQVHVLAVLDHQKQG